MQDAMLREIGMQYEVTRAKNRMEEARRLGEAASVDPMIGKLTEHRAALFRERMMAAFDNPDKAFAIGEALRADIERIQADIRSRLTGAGFPEEYLQPVYECALCQDTGFVGEPVRERCACYARRVREYASSAPAQGLDASQTFETYDDTVFFDAPLGPDTEDTQRAYMARMRERCESYADLFPHNPRRNLLLLGMSGLGKTFLMHCIGNRVREKGVEVIALTAYQLTQRMQAAVFAHSPQGFASLLDVPLLLLDDLGVEPLINNVTIEQLFTLLNERDLAGLHTVISTNLMTDELKARYTERVCSRLFDKRSSLMLPFKGKDLRLR